MAGWLDCSAGKNSDADSITNAQTVGSPEKTADVTSKQGNDVELRYACEPTSSHEDCSTSGTHQPEYFRVQQRSRVGGGERSKRKRRRGRDDDVGYTHSVSFNESTKQELSTSTANVSRAHQVILMTQRQPGRVSGHCREGWLSAAAPKGGSLAAASIGCPKGWLSDAAWKGGCRLLPGRVAHWLQPGRVAHGLLPQKVAGRCLKMWPTK